MEVASFLPYLYRVLQPTFPDCLWAGTSDRPIVALTFDDGPHSRHTSELVEVLDRHSIIASFFWLGICVDRTPDLAREIWQRGHWIGLHGYDHRSFPLLSTSELQQTLAQTQRSIAQACHLDLADVQAKIRDVRPPNGLFTPQILRQLRQWNYRPVMWSVVPEDWVRPGVDKVVQRVLAQVCNGAHIVLHDGYCGGEDVAETVDRLIPCLLDRGYEFVTIDELWQARSIAACDAPPKTETTPR
ncbi:polysaccharide deacetylase family protein [Microcoleus sp. FACHB-1515]|uniref:polysaccharide deacetylase family protein n=1 Tax=Cyanophyceae TaxID=3028117 RepID=UPI001687107A|nr:polysaccharide deacetylase family protein [Microcoleus sp. FACHB-1515]MBD2090328.1 polysaccharide deacetylase family protein [Microcoleus sp. FACHB-1515]